MPAYMASVCKCEDIDRKLTAPAPAKLVSTQNPSSTLQEEGGYGEYSTTLVASFPGSLLTPMKNKNGGGEPGIDSHMISRHDNITAIIAKVVTHSCRHVIG